MDSLERIANSVAILGEDEVFDDKTWISFIEDVVYLYKDYVYMETSSGFVDRVFKKLKNDGKIRIWSM